MIIIRHIPTDVIYTSSWVSYNETNAELTQYENSIAVNYSFLKEDIEILFEWDIETNFIPPPWYVFPE